VKTSLNQPFIHFLGGSAEVCHCHVLRGSAERSDAALHQIDAGRLEVGQQCRPADGDDEIRQQTYDSNLA